MKAEHSVIQGYAELMMRQIYQTLEEDIYYVMRCLDKVNQPFDKDKLVSISNLYYMVIIYPFNEDWLGRNIKHINPMFCLGVGYKHSIGIEKEPYVELFEVNNIKDIIW